MTTALFHQALGTLRGLEPLYQYPEWIPFVIYAIVLVFVLILSIGASCLFADPKNRSKLPMLTTISGLCMISLSLTIIPVDIFIVSQTLDPTKYALAIRIIYYVSFSVLLVFAFVLIPFSYFYYEESDGQASLASRIFGALKYTIFTLIAGAIVVVAAIILAFGFGRNASDTKEWIRTIVDAENYGSHVFSFLVACMACIGLIFWNIYVSYGLAALPVGLIKSFTLLSSKARDRMESDVENLVSKIKNLKDKYMLSGKTWSKRDRKEMRQLRGKKKYLEEKIQKMDEARASWTFKVQPLLYPIKLLVGLAFLAITIFLLASLIVSQIDRILNSSCGILCGFILNKSSLFNPFDKLLTYASFAFPVDYIIFGLFIGLVMLAMVVGLANIGIRLLCINLYKVRLRNTLPQGLLTACVFLMFVIVVFSFQIMSFAPQYATFGSQRYFDSKSQSWEFCDYSALPNSTYPPTPPPSNTSLHVQPVIFDGTLGNATVLRPCFMTQIAHIVNSVALRAPVLSIIFYFQNFVFIGCFVLSFVIALFRRPCSLSADTSRVDEDEEGEGDKEGEFGESRRLTYRERMERRKRDRERRSRTLDETPVVNGYNTYDF